MSDFIVTKTGNNKAHHLVNKYEAILMKHGYSTVENSVHGKNQTRFLHFILEKGGQKYFSKANLPDQYETHINSGLVKKLANNTPSNIEFLAPLDIIEEDDIIFHIYRYIDQRPISNESAGFADFSVSKSDTDNYLNLVLDAIEHVASSQFVTANEGRRSLSIQSVAASHIRKLPNDTPYAVEFLKYLLEQPKLRDFRLAITDIQPQNMFWVESEKKLIMFDLDAIGPQLRYFDQAKFASQLWVVYDRSDLAIRFIELFLARLTSEEMSEAYRYLRFNFTNDALLHYAIFKDHESRERTVHLMKWIRKDLLEMINSAEC